MSVSGKQPQAEGKAIGKVQRAECTGSFQRTAQRMGREGENDARRGQQAAGTSSGGDLGANVTTWLLLSEMRPMRVLSRGGTCIKFYISKESIWLLHKGIRVEAGRASRSYCYYQETVRARTRAWGQEGGEK